MISSDLMKKIEQNSIFNYFFSSLKRHILLSAILSFILLAVISCVGTYNISTTIVHSMTADRMDTELDRLLEDLGGRYWSIENGGLYCGPNYYGNGTEEEAQLEKFLDFERLTGTFCYTFVIDDSASLGAVHATETRLPYDQGHFLRVAGSTLSPDGTSIVGTYMSKEVSDRLDAHGRYQGIANVDGGLIYCIYETLNDKDGNVVGAIVVGRNLNAINQQILEYTMYFLIIVILTLIPLTFIIIKFIQYITHNIICINEYIKKIDAYQLPENKIQLLGIDEFHEIGENINKMIDKIRLSESYRTMAETDTLTKMHNRLFISYTYEKVRKRIITQKLPFCIEIVDIDFFKQYNDNYGHQAGDECLKQVAKVLTSIADDENIYASRWGGDEFLLMYIGYSKEAIFAMEEELHEKIHQIAIPHQFSKVSDVVSITQGAYVFDSLLDRSFSSLFDQADAVLYSLKQNRRDSYAVNDLSSLNDTE